MRDFMLYLLQKQKRAADAVPQGAIPPTSSSQS